MTENDSSWFQEDSSWRKTTSHGEEARKQESQEIENINGTQIFADVHRYQSARLGGQDACKLESWKP
jgi:hypothetical protein